jgi:hypothetical protein
MNGSPPVVALWLLARLVSHTERESLLGDLVEQSRLGKSNVWFWQQTVSAIAGSALAEFRAHYVAILLLAFGLGFAAAAALGTVKIVANFALLDASLAAFGAGWLVARILGFTSALAFLAIVLALALPPVYGPVMQVLDHFGGLWLITHYGMQALPDSIAWTSVCILAGALLGARPRAGVPAPSSATP